MSNPLPYFLPTVLPGPGEGDPPRVDGTLTPAPDARTEALDLILVQYLESPTLLAFLGAHLDQCTSLDNAIVSVYEDSFDVERALGVWLDRLGRVVGESRRGRSDADFRRGVRVRILINRSSGRVRDLAAVARLLEELEEDDQVRVRPEGTATVSVRIDGAPVGIPHDVHAYLLETVAAGVRLITITIPYGFDPDTAFRLVTVAEAESKSAVGLADEARTFGGALAHALG